MGQFWRIGAAFALIYLAYGLNPCSSQQEVSDLNQYVFEKSSEDDSVFLDGLAEDSWRYLHSTWATSNSLPYSWRSDGSPWGNYSNPAEIGLYALSWIAAYDLQRPWSPSWDETESNVMQVLDQLLLWQGDGTNAYANSVFYEGYWIDHLKVGSGRNDHNVSSVDNAWLALSLMTIREYSEANGHFALANKSDAVLEKMNFRLWYHPDNGSFSSGAAGDPLGGLQPKPRYSDKNRIVNFVSRSMGQISSEELKKSLAAFEPPEDGRYKGIVVEDVNSDGSYLDYAAPALFLREMSTSYGIKTISPATQAQIAYAKDQGYPVWGLSGCFDSADGSYVLQGAEPCADSNLTEARPGLVAPYTSALALITPLDSEAIDNLRQIKSLYPCAYDSKYGFHDSIMVSPKGNESCHGHFSALAQEWTLLSIADHDKDFIWRYLYKDPGAMQAHREIYSGDRGRKAS